MHRSGSSAVAGCLAQLGLAMPINLLGADVNNPMGHFEPIRIVDLNDRLLFDASTRWDDWRQVDLSRLEPERLASYKDELRALILEEYREAPIFVLKDPRLCRLAGLYLDVLQSLGVAAKVVLPVRDPAAVAGSLERRDGMARGFAELLWLRHVLDAERLSRGLPRAIFTYEDLLGDPARVLSRAGEALNLRWPAGEDGLSGAAHHLSGELDHSGAGTTKQRNVSDLANRTWNIMGRLARGEAVDEELASLNREFEAASFAGDAIRDELSQREARALRRIVAVERQLADTEVRLAEEEAQRREAAQHTPSTIEAPARRRSRSRPALALSAPISALYPQFDTALTPPVWDALRVARRTGIRRTLQLSLQALRSGGIRHFLARARDVVARERLAAGRRPPGPQALLDERTMFIAEHHLGPISYTSSDIRPPRVVIVTDTTLPQCFKFRVADKIAILETLNIPAVHVSPQDLYASLNALQFASAVIFYRLSFDGLFTIHIQEARRLGLRVFYDIDDPIFDAGLIAGNEGLQRLSAEIRFSQVAQAPGFALALAATDGLIGSTPNLAALMGETALRQNRRLPTFVWRNAAERPAGVPEPAPAATSHGRLTLGYFSGSLSHEADFDIMLPALTKLMRERQDIDLLIGGHTGARAKLAPFADRIRRLPFAGYADYLRNVAACDLVLVPLSTDPFNDHKSAVRFLDAALMRRPVLASPVGDYPGLIEDGVTGWLAGRGDWFAKLRLAVGSRQQLARVGQNAGADVDARFSLSSVGAALPSSLIEALRGLA